LIFRIEIGVKKALGEITHAIVINVSSQLQFLVMQVLVYGLATTNIDASKVVIMVPRRTSGTLLSDGEKLPWNVLALLD
jgi:hypothetical protein